MEQTTGCNHSYVKATSRSGDAWYFSWLCKGCGDHFPREPDGERKYILSPSKAPTPPKTPKERIKSSENGVVKVDFT